MQSEGAKIGGKSKGRGGKGRDDDILRGVGPTVSPTPPTLPLSSLSFPISSSPPLHLLPQFSPAYLRELEREKTAANRELRRLCTEAEKMADLLRVAHSTSKNALAMCESKEDLRAQQLRDAELVLRAAQDAVDVAKTQSLAAAQAVSAAKAHETLAYKKFLVADAAHIKLIDQTTSASAALAHMAIVREAAEERELEIPSTMSSWASVGQAHEEARGVQIGRAVGSGNNRGSSVLREMPPVAREVTDLSATSTKSMTTAHTTRMTTIRAITPLPVAVPTTTIATTVTTRATAIVATTTSARSVVPAPMPLTRAPVTTTPLPVAVPTPTIATTVTTRATAIVATTTPVRSIVPAPVPPIRASTTISVADIFASSARPVTSFLPPPPKTEVVLRGVASTSNSTARVSVAAPVRQLILVPAKTPIAPSLATPAPTVNKTSPLLPTLARYETPPLILPPPPPKSLLASQIRAPRPSPNFPVLTPVIPNAFVASAEALLAHLCSFNKRATSLCTPASPEPVIYVHDAPLKAIVPRLSALEKSSAAIALRLAASVGFALDNAGNCIRQNDVVGAITAALHAKCSFLRLPPSHNGSSLIYRLEAQLLLWAVAPETTTSTLTLERALWRDVSKILTPSVHDTCRVTLSAAALFNTALVRGSASIANAADYQAAAVSLADGLKFVCRPFSALSPTLMVAFTSDTTSSVVDLPPAKLHDLVDALRAFETKVNEQDAELVNLQNRAADANQDRKSVVADFEKAALLAVEATHKSSVLATVAAVFCRAADARHAALELAQLPSRWRSDLHAATDAKNAQDKIEREAADFYRLHCVLNQIPLTSFEADREQFQDESNKILAALPPNLSAVFSKALITNEADKMRKRIHNALKVAVNLLKIEQKNALDEATGAIAQASDTSQQLLYAKSETAKAQTSFSNAKLRHAFAEVRLTESRETLRKGEIVNSQIINDAKASIAAAEVAILRAKEDTSAATEATTAAESDRAAAKNAQLINLEAAREAVKAKAAVLPLLATERIATTTLESVHNATNKRVARAREAESRAAATVTAVSARVKVDIAALVGLENEYAAAVDSAGKKRAHALLLKAEAAQAVTALNQADELVATAREADKKSSVIGIVSTFFGPDPVPAAAAAKLKSNETAIAADEATAAVKLCLEEVETIRVKIIEVRLASTTSTDELRDADVVFADASLAAKEATEAAAADVHHAEDMCARASAALKVAQTHLGVVEAVASIRASEAIELETTAKETTSSSINKTLMALSATTVAKKEHSAAKNSLKSANDFVLSLKMNVETANANFKTAEEGIIRESERLSNAQESEAVISNNAVRAISRNAEMTDKINIANNALFSFDYGAAEIEEEEKEEEEGGRDNATNDAVAADVAADKTFSGFSSASKNILNIVRAEFSGGGSTSPVVSNEALLYELIKLNDKLSERRYEEIIDKNSSLDKDQKINYKAILKRVTCKAVTVNSIRDHKNVPTIDTFFETENGHAYTFLTLSKQAAVAANEALLDREKKHSIVTAFDAQAQQVQKLELTLTFGESPRVATSIFASLTQFVTAGAVSNNQPLVDHTTAFINANVNDARVVVKASLTLLTVAIMATARAVESTADSSLPDALSAAAILASSFRTLMRTHIRARAWVGVPREGPLTSAAPLLLDAVNAVTKAADFLASRVTDPVTTKALEGLSFLAHSVHVSKPEVAIGLASNLFVDGDHTETEVTDVNEIYSASAVAALLPLTASYVAPPIAMFIKQLVFAGTDKAARIDACRVLVSHFAALHDDALRWQAADPILTKEMAHTAPEAALRHVMELLKYGTPPPRASLGAVAAILHTLAAENVILLPTWHDVSQAWSALQPILSLLRGLSAASQQKRENGSSSAARIFAALIKNTLSAHAGDELTGTRGGLPRFCRLKTHDVMAAEVNECVSERPAPSDVVSLLVFSTYQLHRVLTHALTSTKEISSALAVRDVLEWTAVLDTLFSLVTLTGESSDKFTQLDEEMIAIAAQGVAVLAAKATETDTHVVTLSIVDLVSEILLTGKTASAAALIILNELDAACLALSPTERASPLFDQNDAARLIALPAVPLRLGLYFANVTSAAAWRWSRQLALRARASEAYLQNAFDIAMHGMLSPNEGRALLTAAMRIINPSGVVTPILSLSTITSVITVLNARADAAVLGTADVVTVFLNDPRVASLLPYPVAVLKRYGDGVKNNDEGVSGENIVNVTNGLNIAYALYVKTCMRRGFAPVVPVSDDDNVMNLHFDRFQSTDLSYQSVSAAITPPRGGSSAKPSLLQLLLRSTSLIAAGDAGEKAFTAMLAGSSMAMASGDHVTTGSSSPLAHLCSFAVTFFRALNTDGVGSKYKDEDEYLEFFGDSGAQLNRVASSLARLSDVSLNDVEILANTLVNLRVAIVAEGPGRIDNGFQDLSHLDPALPALTSLLSNIIRGVLVGVSESSRELSVSVRKAIVATVKLTEQRKDESTEPVALSAAAASLLSVSPTLPVLPGPLHANVRVASLYSFENHEVVIVASSSAMLLLTQLPVGEREIFLNDFAVQALQGGVCEADRVNFKQSQSSKLLADSGIGVFLSTVLGRPYLFESFYGVSPDQDAGVVDTVVAAAAAAAAAAATASSRKEIVRARLVPFVKLWWIGDVGASKQSCIQAVNGVWNSHLLGSSSVIKYLDVDRAPPYGIIINELAEFHASSDSSDALHVERFIELSPASVGGLLDTRIDYSPYANSNFPLPFPFMLSPSEYSLVGKGRTIVVGGSGVGKTLVLVHRMLRAVSTGDHHEGAILAITHNEALSAATRKLLENALAVSGGKYDGYQIIMPSVIFGKLTTTNAPPGTTVLVFATPGQLIDQISCALSSSGHNSITPRNTSSLEVEALLLEKGFDRFQLATANTYIVGSAQAAVRGRPLQTIEDFDALKDDIGTRVLGGESSIDLVKLAREYVFFAKPGDDATRVLQIHRALKILGTSDCVNSGVPCKKCQQNAATASSTSSQKTAATSAKGAGKATTTTTTAATVSSIPVSCGYSLLVRKLHALVVQVAYVDEIQDMSQAELLLLLSLMKDPSFISVSGDSAQAILGGVSFRFDELGAFFTRLKRSATPAVSLLACSLSSTLDISAYLLSVNYRSPDDQLRAAACIIYALLHLFPVITDKGLTEDRGVFKGNKPLLFVHNEIEEFFATVSDSGVPRGTFWPQDIVILVRAEKTRVALRQRLGDNVRCSLITEFKGLEATSVILYNFFCDAPDTPNWAWLLCARATRTNQGAILSKGLSRKDYRFLETNGTATPDLVADKNLEHEMKLLYVALTRARESLWIFESESSDASVAPFRFLESTSSVTSVQRSGVRLVQPLF